MILLAAAEAAVKTPLPPVQSLGALDALAYGLLQGVTDFLPVSSSTHLALLGRAMQSMGRQPLDKAYVMLFHLPTLAAALWVLRREVLALFGSRRALLWPLGLATAVTGLLGSALDRTFSDAGSSLAFLGAGLMATGLVQILVERIRPAAREGPWTWDRGIAVGIGQSLAAVPGLSRLGMSSCAGLLTGRPHVPVVVFSFLCSIPVVLGKTALECRHALSAGEPGFWTHRVLYGAYPLGALAAFLAGVASFRWLLRHLSRRTFVPFGIYCIVLGALTLTWSFTTAKIPVLPNHEPKAGIPGVGPDGDAGPPAHEPAVLRPEGSPALPAP